MKKLNTNKNSPEKIYLKDTQNPGGRGIDLEHMFHNRKLEDIILTLSQLKKSDDEIISFELVRNFIDTCDECGGSYENTLWWTRMILETDAQFENRQNLISRRREERKLKSQKAEERKERVEKEKIAAQVEKDRLLYEKLKKRFGD